MNTTQRITDLYKQSLGDSPEAPKTPLKRTWTASMGIRYQQTDATFLPNQQAVDQEKVIQRDPCLYSNIIGVFQIYAMEHHHHHPSSIVSSRTLTREMIGETIRVRLPGGSDKLDKKSSNNNLGEEVLINVHMSSDAAMIDSVSVTTFAEEPMASVEQVADAKMNSILSQQQEIESALASSKVATEQMLEDCVPLSSSSSSSSSSSLSLSPATAAAGDPTIQDIGAQVLEQRILERKLQEISGDITRIQVDRFAFKCVYFITAGEFKLININDRLYQFHLLRYEYAPQEIVLYKRSYLLQRAVYCTDIKCRLHLRCGVPTKNLHYQRPPAASMMDHLSAFQCSYKNIKRTEREQEQESGSKRRRRCRSDPSSSDIDIVDLEESDTRDSWIDEDTNSFM